MSETPADIASLIDDAVEPASVSQFRAVQRRCLAALTTSDSQGVLLFSAAMVAADAAERIERGDSMTNASNQGWRALASALAVALTSGDPSDLDACIRLLYPPTRQHQLQAKICLHR